jgi:hypothetical protein
LNHKLFHSCIFVGKQGSYFTTQHCEDVHIAKVGGSFGAVGFRIDMYSATTPGGSTVALEFQVFQQQLGTKGFAPPAAGVAITATKPWDDTTAKVHSKGTPICAHPNVVLKQ